MKKNYSVFFIFFAFIISLGISLNITTKKAFATDDSLYQSKSAYLMDSNTKTVIYSKNETQRAPIASMCKIMTLLLTFDEIKAERLNFSDEIIVSNTASGMGGSQVFLEANVPYSADTLIKSVVVASANDASVALAEHICGSEEVFVDKMNQKAQELDMSNTYFVNCTGLPKEGQYSCAKDVAIMFNELLNHKDYFRFSTIWMDEIKHTNDRITSISNTNKLIRFYDGCDSGKTGYTSQAGHCLAASAVRNDMRLISVIISAPDSKTRFKEASNLFNYGFANYCNKKVVDNNVALDEQITVVNGKQDSIEVVPEYSYYIFSNKTDKHSIELVFNPNSRVVAPVQKGDVVGELIVYNNGVQIAIIPVVSNENVNKASYFDNVKNITEHWALI